MYNTIQHIPYNKHNTYDTIQTPLEYIQYNKYDTIQYIK